ncbi:carboxyl-terminal protease [Emticicia oligotrophica DSM 17448]|uniref:Carboxyl-terminal protease n=1 Tax=Emticicia oligotrophica (strain DSM 17448 / CIP 109782 / MTCC 6937 / GPTSA100-15) TaxID=929562 RepID=A0ABN4ANV3_EMTOG|nr:MULTISPECIES: carboxy terminal-processing peptidase [Emticicia]AFK03441.1 carboxyl-terminal protease [Emticicia oligotrophica DSM 17448]
MKKPNLFSIAFLSVSLLTIFISATPLNDDPPSKNETILRYVGAMLEQGHYSPKKIDDNFSKEIFNEYLKRLDPSKRILLEKDISKLKKFETTIDDEIHGSPLTFFAASDEIYKIRIAEAEEIYKQNIEKPFDFTKDEAIEFDADKVDFPSNDSERKERWRKYLKWQTLDRYLEAQEQQEKNKDKKDFVVKSDQELEKEARAKVKKAMDKYFDRLRNKFDENQRFAMLVTTITNEMDPHTDFFAPVEKRSFDERLSGRFFGIGALLQQEDDKIKIRSVTTGGPAWKSGEIQANDFIVKVAQATGEAEDVTGYTTDDAVKLIRGAEGTEVKITVQKPDGTLKTVSLIRAELKLDETFARSVIINSGKHKIGLIDLPAFYADFQRPQAARCSQDVAKEVTRLKAEGVDGIILDIRDNGGGSLQEVVNMVGLFIKTGPVVQIRDRSGRPSQMGDSDPSVLYDGPLVVMVNERSASASEIFASAIQDYKRGVVVGSTSTFGKGTVQRAFPVGGNISGSGAGDLGSVHLTLQKYYRVDGGATQLKGVESDIVLPGLYEAYKIREKDSPNALVWDEMPKANYQSWTYAPDLAALKQKNAERLSTNDVFNQIKENTNILADNRRTSRSLEIQKYKAQQKEVRDISTKVRNLTQLKDDLAVANLASDLAVINTDSLKKDRNDFWIKYLKKDVYLGETVNVMNDVIEQKGMAMKN